MKYEKVHKLFLRTYISAKRGVYIIGVRGILICMNFTFNLKGSTSYDINFYCPIRYFMSFYSLKLARWKHIEIKIQIDKKHKKRLLDF